jgi:hypothetical protein
MLPIKVLIRQKIVFPDDTNDYAEREILMMFPPVPEMRIRINNKIIIAARVFYDVNDQQYIIYPEPMNPLTKSQQKKLQDMGFK